MLFISFSAKLARSIYGLARSIYGPLNEHSGLFKLGGTRGTPRLGVPPPPAPPSNLLWKFIMENRVGNFYNARQEPTCLCPEGLKVGAVCKQAL